jgi:hypothetical protein
MKKRVSKSNRGYAVVERHTGDVVGTYRTRADATRDMRAMGGSGLRVVTIAKPQNAARKNPTKAQKREASRKASVRRRVAVALAKFLKQANPAMKTEGATVTRLKGGGFTIRPIKAVKRGRR